MHFFSLFPSLRTTIIILTTCIALGLTFFYTSNDLFQSLIISTIFFVFLPLCVVSFVLREPLSHFGWQLPKKSSAWGVGTLFLLIGTVLFFGIAYGTKTLPLVAPPAFVSESLWLYIFFFGIFLGGFSFFYEVLFRGFFQLGLSQTLGWKSIFVQWVIFLLFLLIADIFSWESFYFILSSLFASILIFFYRSIFLSFLFSWIFGILTLTISLLLIS